MINTPKIYKMRIVFRWNDGETEHPHALRGIKRMVLDSGLPYEPSKFVQSLPRLAYGPALAKGQRAEREYLDIYLREHCSEEEVCRCLQQAAPAGLDLLQVKRVPYPLPSVQNLAAAARYRVKGNFGLLAPSGRKIEEWAGKGNLFVIQRAENGMVYQKEITPFVLEAKTLSPDEVSLTLACVNGKWITPQWVIAAWLGKDLSTQEDAFAEDEIIFIRECFCWEDSQGELHPM